MYTCEGCLLVLLLHVSSKHTQKYWVHIAVSHISQLPFKNACTALPVKCPFLQSYFLLPQSVCSPDSSLCSRDMTQPVRRTDILEACSLVGPAKTWTQKGQEWQTAANQKDRLRDFSTVAHRTPAACHKPRKASVSFSITQLLLNMTKTSFI